MTDDVREIAQGIRMQVDRLAKVATLGSGHWVHAYVAGDAIGTDEAAFIADCSPQTIRRRAVELEAAGTPIGIWFARSVWLISKELLLDDIERREGRHGRNAAVSRAEKYAALNLRSQNSARDGAAATG